MPPISRIAIPQRVTVKSWQPRVPAHVDISAIRWKWYYKYLWKFLRKLGVQYIEEVPECWPVQTREIDHRDIIRMIESSSKAMDLLWYKKATTLIVGYDEYSKLMNDAPREFLTCCADLPLVRSETNLDYKAPPVVHHTRYCGLKIVCVPWLEGWALLPDLEK